MAFGLAFLDRKLAFALSGSSILLAAALASAQAPPARLRGPQAAAAQPTAPGTLVAAQTAPAQPTVATSLLQQPAHEARIAFAGDTLSIHADNSSLAGILRQFAAKSGMKIEGLGGDERVFGSFGPGAPRDVLADLLHGTNYNLVLLGDMENGAPRELILTPTTHSGAAAAATAPMQNPGAPAANAEDAPAEPVATESDAEPQGPLDLPTPIEDSPPAPANDTPAAPGVKSPQQLFEQLQRMRQTQQNTTPDAVQQDSTTQ